MKVSVVILTYNREKIVSRLIENISRLSLVSEILLVDNSPSPILAKLQDCFPNFLYIEGNNDKGTFSRNLGILKSKGDIIICLDDDIFGLTDNEIKNLVDLFGGDRLLGAVCFKVLNNNGEISNWCHHCAPEDFSDKDFLTCEISEGAVAFRKSVLDTVGLFPDNFFISHEGFDLALRIIQDEKKIIYSPRISVVHHHAQEGRPSWRRYYYDTRNIFLVWANNMSFFFGMKYAIRGMIPLLFYSLRDGFIQYYIQGVRDGVSQYLKHRKPEIKLSRQTVEYLTVCHSNKPGFLYMFKKRVLKKGVSL